MTCSPLADHRPPTPPGKGEGATLTSVPVGGFVKHQHGIIHLKWNRAILLLEDPPDTRGPVTIQEQGSYTHSPLSSLGFILNLLPCWGQLSICDPTGGHSNPPFNHQILNGPACKY